MISEEMVRLDQAGSMANITLSRPDDCNVLCKDMVTQLAEVVRQFNSYIDVRYVLLTGTG